MRKFLKYSSVVLAVIIGLPLLVLAISAAVMLAGAESADFQEVVIEGPAEGYVLDYESDSLRICGNNSLVRNRYGLWEVLIEGDAERRGCAYGLLNGDLLRYQEDVFVRQIRKIIPSERYIEFLHKVIIFFNRDMAAHVPYEFRREISAISHFCTDEYNAYGSPYVRQLNYHAAHDIGHMMQQYMLVGCSSFAAWDGKTADGELLVGRNFDFYMGEDFAKNKIVLFMKPDDGYDFVSVTWPGMMGVTSGMNEKGLTVTINASSGSVPLSSAMPISLLAREILQYASNIGEAYSIAEKRRTFVSESLLIGSAAEGRAAIIEKTPEQISLYSASDDYVVCTNHYQSDIFRDDPYNVKNLAESDSPYRFRRLTQLIEGHENLTPEVAVGFLRDRYGVDGEDIGLCNPMAINQFIAHHSVVFQPEKLLMWVSTSPWQLGEYICYDLNEVFSAELPLKASVNSAGHNIAADSASIRAILPDVLEINSKRLF